MEVKRVMLPIIFLLVQEFVCDCDAAATSSRSPASPPPSKEEWKEPKSGTHPSTTSRPTTTKSIHALGSRVAGGHIERDLHKDHHKTYLVEADELTMGHAYEKSINPFLFHVEQSWRLKPLRHHHRYLKKKMFQQQHHPLQHEEHPVGGNKHQSVPHVAADAVSAADELPENPNRPHFIDSDEAVDNGDEGRAFGDEEKDLRDLFQVLFSPDY